MLLIVKYVRDICDRDCLNANYEGTKTLITVLQYCARFFILNSYYDIYLIKLKSWFVCLLVSGSTGSDFFFLVLDRSFIEKGYMLFNITLH